MDGASARKIPQLRFLHALVLLAFFTLPCALLAEQAPDSQTVYRAARKAETSYESALRSHAPIAPRSRPSGTCDEIVGRFCLYYDTGRDPLPAEPAAIKQFRRDAIAALRRAFELNAGRQETVFPLVRLLVEDKQPMEAVAVADKYRAVASDVATVEFLTVFTRFAAADITRAEEAITRWLEAVDSASRRKLVDVSKLLSEREQRAYRRLTATQRAAFDSIFWRYADALYLTPGNETRTEHFARHAEGKLIQKAPWVRGAHGWASDVEELLIRFGPIRARTRTFGGSIGSPDPDISEYWDPEQLMFAPPSLDSALNLRARPAQGWPLDTVRSVSGHAPSTFRRMLPLEHQATLYRAANGQIRFRVDGQVVADSVGPIGPVNSGLYLLDDSMRIVATSTGATSVAGDTIRFSAEIPVPPNARHYSAELLDPGRRVAARARFRLQQANDSPAISLSDILIAEAFPPGGLPVSRADTNLRPQPTLVTKEGEPLGIMAEVVLGSAPDSVRVQLQLLNARGRPAVVRAARWIGERIGLVGAEVPNRLSWIAEVPTNDPTPIAVTLDPEGLRPGRYLIELTVTTSTGAAVSSRREVLIRP